MKTLVILAFVAASLGAQTLASFTATRETTGTTEKVTIQQPASGSRTVVFKEAYVYCSSGCDIAQSRNGTGATSMALTRQPLNPEAVPSAAATAWHTSNVGAGSAIAPTVTLGSTTGYEKTLDLSGIRLVGDGITKNYTVSVTNAGGGTIRVVIKWSEE